MNKKYLVVTTDGVDEWVYCQTNDFNKAIETKKEIRNSEIRRCVWNDPDNYDYDVIEGRYQVELVQLDNNASVVNSNSWADESEFFDTIEEAEEEAQTLAESWHMQQAWDAVLINEYNAEFDTWECVKEIKL
jgi:hypothetical protein